MFVITAMTRKVSGSVKAAPNASRAPVALMSRMVQSIVVQSVRTTLAAFNVRWR